MERYSEQTKLAAIDAYLTGQRGLVATAEQMGVGVSSLRKWIAAYEANGVAGIRWHYVDLYRTASHGQPENLTRFST